MPIRLGPRSAGAKTVNVIVETPAGSPVKYRYEEESGLFLFYKRLPAGMVFPFDFGFVPGTRAEDGDPLDVMLVGPDPALQGCLVTARLLGVLEAEQTETGSTIRNDRLIGVPETRKIRPPERTLADLPAGRIEQIERFFAVYNQAEGRTFRTIGRRGPQVAARLVARAAAAASRGRRR